MEGGMNDSGIVVEVHRSNCDFRIDVENLKQIPSNDMSETSSGNSSGSDSRMDEVKKIDSKSETPSDELNDSLPPYSAVISNESSDMLLSLGSVENGKKDKKTPNCCLHAITMTILAIGNFLQDHKTIVYRVLTVLFIFWNLIWLVVAAVKDWTRCLPFFVIICLIIFFSMYGYIRDRFGNNIIKSFRPCTSGFSSCSQYMKWFALVLIIAALTIWIIFDTSKRPFQLISMVGYLVFLFILFVFSKTPEHVIWRPVIWGCGIQICLGLFILRTNAGFSIFNYLGDLVQTFLGFVTSGCKFVFGDKYVDHYFALGVLPIIIYFSAFISILYHLGAMQWVISKIAWVMQSTLGTSATESMVAAGNIFVGQTESPLLIRPYIKDLTTSEMHAVMTAGFGTIAGSVLGAYLGFGIKAVYVITACVMAAPCALAVSKLMYPETKISKFTSDEALVLESSGHRNVIEAAFVGASQAIPLVLNIGANLIAFIALLAGVNAFLGWYGSLVDIENLSFEYICSYIFMPFSYLMGIEWVDCFKCAELIGTKIFLNEFIAYEKLSVLIDNKANGTLPRVSDSGDIQWISDRSEAIITYALCGFANIGSLGIMLGGLGGMCPERQGEMAKIVIRALICGIFVSFLNACTAGFFYLPSEVNCTKVFTRHWHSSELEHIHQCCVHFNTTNFNTTVVNSTDIFSECCSTNWPHGFAFIEGC
uniref:sodium/nucleoside cotransporter 1-like n=1 Tax=Styela clava TaxID=7725 RepID=UPI0019396C02|nr:sodium/nucleoside cotransporter 1-like [Styela clava]